ncbi:MAG: META domain-containing protein [Rikenellaceae bacterium]
MKKFQFLALALIVFIVSCGTTRTTSTSKSFNLETTKWQIEELNGEAIDAKADSFTIEFREDKRIGAKGSCNIIIGDYSYSNDGTLTLRPVGATRTACPDMTTEMEYISALEKATSFEVDGNNLTLLSGKKIVAKFKSLQ